MEDVEETGLSGLASHTDSISKGVFAFRRGTKRQNGELAPKSPSKKAKVAKTGKKAKKKGTNANAIFGTSPNGLMRQRLYETTWDAISAKMKELQKSVFDAVLQNVIEFCLKATPNAANETLPTCAFVAGVNLPDHDDLFKLLSKGLRKFVSDHVAMLRSSDCSSLKILVKKLVLQLYKGGNASMDEINEDDSDTEEVARNTSKFVATLPNFASWYNSQYYRCAKKPLIIILEDFEGFSSQMLQDLIANLTEYQGRLPFVVIFGIATTVDAIHRSLPHCTTSKLAIDSFASAPSIHLLAKFVESLVLDANLPFKLGASVLKVLLETFTFHDLSVKHFLMAFKLCLFEHYSANEFAVLCCPKAQRLDALSTLTSLEKLVAKWKFSSVETFKMEYLNQVDGKVQLFNAFVITLHALVANLPRQPLGKNFHHVYNLSMAEPVTQTGEYREAFQFLKMSEKCGISQMLQTFITSLEPYEPNLPKVGEICSQARQFLEDLENKIGSSVVEESKTVDKIKSEEPEKATTNSPSNSKGKLNIFKLQEMLLEQAREKKVKAMNPFEQLREKIMAFLHSTFTAYLNSRPIQWQGFYQIFYFDDVDLVKQRLRGAPRNATQMALRSPNHYLENANLETSTEEEIPPSLPDICIAYKLHLECGRLINLYDWLQCWLSIVGSTAEEKENEEKSNSQLLHARFSRAVSELQFLGFIKPSKRKTDHVERLTF